MMLAVVCKCQFNRFCFKLGQFVNQLSSVSFWKGGGG